MNRQTSSFFSLFMEKLQGVKKTDWLALALAGAILLIIALPEDTDSGHTTNVGNLSAGNQTNAVETAGNMLQSQKEPGAGNSAEEYVSKLEERLEEVLEQMDGVGKVKVMITISDYGESIVEKDLSETNNTVTEVENDGGNKTSVERAVNEQTVQVEDENGTYPYIEKEILPTIEGIVVVAEGGGNATVVSNISKTAMALFPIEAHKIIVVKMSDKGD